MKVSENNREQDNVENSRAFLIIPHFILGKLFFDSEVRGMGNQKIESN